jgi:hypothetical protein
VANLEDFEEELAAEGSPTTDCLHSQTFETIRAITSSLPIKWFVGELENAVQH